MRFPWPIYFFLFFSSLTHGQNTLDSSLKEFNKGTVPYINVHEAITSEKALFFDTRQKEEFDISHIKNAIWLGSKSFGKDPVNLKTMDKNTEIIVYCSIGVRSENVGEKLSQMGFTNVKNLYGGIFEWKNQGFPVYDLQENETEKVHVFNRHWGKLLKKGSKVYHVKRTKEHGKNKKDQKQEIDSTL